ncbi:MAG: amidohydrolase family protein, partial [Actinobacteria bacterium]|nr:amidohydrolase family protein [Actinomycetota bacterium]
MATLFRGGTLFDGEQYAGAAQVLVADGRIAAVSTGDAADQPLDVPAGTRVVDLEGGLLAPGFVDAHVHVVQGGLERVRCDLSGLDGREAYLAAVRAYAAAHPDLPWIQGGGWAMAAFPGGTPTAADLDAVVPDRPVALPNRDHHGLWVNSR